MRKVITILVALTALFATLQAKTITETRMHIYQNGSSYAYKIPMNNVDSIKFTECTYKSINDSIKNLYTIIFMQDDGTILQFDNLAFGATPKCTAPIRDRTSKYDVVFKCWIPELRKVDSDILYKAKYDSLSRDHKYTVIFRDKKGSILKTLQEVTYYQAMCVSKVMYDSTMQSYRSYTDAGIEEDLISKDTLIYTIELGKEIKSDVEGALSYPYAINDSTFVFFSKGNLQYNGADGKTHKTLDGVAKGTLQFSEKQYDYLGEENLKVDTSYNGLTDHLMWKTIGKDSTDENCIYHNAGSSKQCKLDWGLYNAISNGGDQPGLWRSLSKEEWTYILNHNNWTMGYITGEDTTFCLLIAPPHYSDKHIIQNEYTNTYEIDDFDGIYTGYNGKIIFYSEKEFEGMEEQGVVALPCAGSDRNYEINKYGNIWTLDNHYCYYYCLYFGATNGFGDGRSNISRKSVRLVHEVNK